MRRIADRGSKYHQVGDLSRNNLSKVFSRGTLRRDARAILRRSLAACSVSRILRAGIELRGHRLTASKVDHRLPEGGRTLILAVGKAAATMARSFQRILPRGMSFRGLAIVPADSEIPPQSLRVRKSSHPYPTLRSLRAGLELTRLVRSVLPGDTVIYLVSGGASALAAVPLPGLSSITEKRLLHRSLIESG